jgi:hydrogenase expression/formation protein HypE
MAEKMDNRITLAHGSGGSLTHKLIRETFLPLLSNPLLSRLDDGAVFGVDKGHLAFTTDSYVVNPLFFPGGDIGRLAVYGTVNDLSMCGARPLYLSLSLIIEEGFSQPDLQRIISSVRGAALEADVEVITGDTKVVGRGSADGLFITTSGIGIVPEDIEVSGANAKAGDKVILSGTLGDHGMTILIQREGLGFEGPMESDCAPLNQMVSSMLEASHDIHCLRDPTRGGLATTLNEIALQSEVGVLIEEDAIPLNPSVSALCELLGFDPLYVANEGKLVAMVEASDSDRVLEAMKENKYGKRATIIGEVTEKHPGRVVIRTRMGTSRILDMLTGDLLPRIC